MRQRDTQAYIKALGVDLALLIAAAYIIFNPGSSNVKKITLDVFTDQAKTGEIAKVIVKDNRLDITRIDNTLEYAYKENGQTVADLLKDVPDQIKKDISIDVQFEFVGYVPNRRNRRQVHHGAVLGGDVHAANQ